MMEEERLSKNPNIMRSSLLDLPMNDGGEFKNSLFSHGQSICDEIDLIMYEREENRTFTMVLRSGEKNFEEILNINMDKEMELI